MSPFRQPLGQCELCGAQVEPSELEPVALLDVCGACRTGELREASRRHRISSRARPWYLTGDAEEIVELPRLTVDGCHATELEVSVSFEPEPRFLGSLTPLVTKRDPRTGDQEFDRAVRITELAGMSPQTAAILQRDGARAAILALVERGARVDVSFRHVIVRLKAARESALPPAEEVEVLLFALCVHLERLATSTTW